MRDTARRPRRARGRTTGETREDYTEHACARANIVDDDEGARESTSFEDDGGAFGACGGARARIGLDDDDV